MQNNLNFQLEVQKTSKFKNNIFYINFIEPLKANNLAKRALLAEMLGNFSANLPSEQAVAQKLSYLYGASFGASVFRLGSQNILQFKISFANSKLLPNQSNLLTESIDFLDQMISEPLVKDGKFSAIAFKRRKANLVHYVETIDEDHAFQSALIIRRLFYGTTNDNGKYILGTPKQISQVSNESLYDYYEEVFKSNQIVAVAVGDIDENEVKTALATTELNNKITPAESIRVPDLRVPFNLHEVEKEVTRYQGDQTTLSLAGYLPVYWGDSEYFAALVGNYLLGGSMQSLLFMNVREKASLAYDIHSNYDSLAGRLTVQTGIAAANIKEAQQLIFQQVERLKNGEFTDQMLVDAKHSLLNQHLSGSDSLRTVANRSFLNYLKTNLSEEKWKNQLENVDKNVIKSTFANLKLQAIHIGLGE